MPAPVNMLLLICKENWKSVLIRSETNNASGNLYKYVSIPDNKHHNKYITLFDFSKEQVNLLGILSNAWIQELKTNISSYL